MPIQGYKAFLRFDDEKLFSKGKKFQFEVGEAYEVKDAVLCKEGFHYCRKVMDVFKYYPTDSVVCKVTDLSNQSSPTDGTKSCTIKLRVDYILNGKVDDDGDCAYFKDGKLHSDDMNVPAVKYKNGNKVWYKKGRTYRDCGLPTVEHANGTKKWWKNGGKHRDGDLPAVEWINGTKEWWKDGQKHRDGDLPAVEFPSGGKEWWKDGKRHRDGDLPAVEYSNGGKEWWKEGKLHRGGDLPAVELSKGRREWWTEGELLRRGKEDSVCVIS